MTTLAVMVQRLISGLFVLAFTSCSATFNVSVPNSKAEGFTTCLSHARGVCKADSVSKIAPALAASNVEHFQGGATSRPVNTALDATFTNPFVASTLTSLRTQADSMAAATANAHEKNIRIELASPSRLKTMLASIERLTPEQKATAAALAEDARAFLGHPVQQSLNGVYNNLADPDQQKDLKKMSFSRSEVEDYVSLGTKLSQQRGWQIHTTAAVINLAADPASAKKLQDASTAIFIEAYVRAYFRNGEFFSGKIKVADIYDRYPDLKAYKTELDPILNKLESKLTYGKIGTAGFVTRTGTSLQVPPIEVTLDPIAKKPLAVSKVDVPTVGAELTRVILEAIFDSIDLLPAVSNATGVRLDLGRPQEGILGLEDMATIKDRQVPSPQQLDEANQITNAIDGAASTTTAQIIRGVNVAALNNEALAKIVESLVGTTARKVGEKVTYCWYTCVDYAAPAALAVEKPLEVTKTVTITVKY